MAQALQDKMKSVGNKCRKKIEARAQQLVAEEMALHEPRKVHHHSQASPDFLTVREKIAQGSRTKRGRAYLVRIPG